MPYRGADGTIQGVAGAGMLLHVLNEIVVETKLGETGYAFISNERGEMIISDTLTIDEDNGIVSKKLSDFLPPETSKRMQNGGSEIERVVIDGNDYFIAYAPLATLPWSLAVVMSVEEVIAPAAVSEEHIIEMTRDAVSDVDGMILIALFVFAAALIVTQVGNTILSKRLAGGLAKPVIELSSGAEIIGAGNLDHMLNVRTGDELEALSDAFNSMISNIKSITAEKERIGAELNIATQIQASMLPCIFPAFPDRKEFDVYASMLPAKEVGGDFYDFFLIDKNKLAVVMADVSGKGVPAALFMVISKTLIKNNAQAGKSPDEVLETVNNMLCENNDANMFVTVFLGVLDIPDGKFTYANAGHNPPLLKRANGDFEWLPTKPGFVLAGMDGLKYRQEQITLCGGDLLLSPRKFT
jgi:sigma-B regulation protein RsbU (phosphoserine phosphatase)